MMNRRDILKYFAAGTVIAPVVGAGPAARLIEIPKVELLEPPKRIIEAVNCEDISKVTITFQRPDGRVMTFAGDMPLRASGRLLSGHTQLSVHVMSEVQNTSPGYFEHTGSVTFQGISQ